MTTKQLYTKTEFTKFWAQTVYLFMPPNFKKQVGIDEICAGIQFPVNYNYQHALEYARYTCGKPEYPIALGRIAAAAMDRLEPLGIIREVEAVEEFVYDYYWEQLYHLRYHLMYQKREEEKYVINEVDSYVYAQEIVSMNVGKGFADFYKNTNCLPGNLMAVSLMFTCIGNTIDYLWVLSQLEPLEKVDNYTLKIMEAMYESGSDRALKCAA